MLSSLGSVLCYCLNKVGCSCSVEKLSVGNKVAYAENNGWFTVRVLYYFKSCQASVQQHFQVSEKTSVLVLWFV